MSDTPETDALREAIDNGAAVEAEMTSLAIKLERERDKAQEDATNYYAKIGELEQERDEAREILREIAKANGFDNIGNWARNKAKSAIYR